MQKHYLVEILFHGHVETMVYTYTKKSTVDPAAILNSTGKLNQRNKTLLQGCFFASISFRLFVYQFDYQKLFIHSQHFICSKKMILVISCQYGCSSVSASFCMDDYIIKNFGWFGIKDTFNKNETTATILDKIFGTKCSNPVKLDRKRNVWYLLTANSKV